MLSHYIIHHGSNLSGPDIQGHIIINTVKNSVEDIQAYEQEEEHRYHSDLR